MNAGSSAHPLLLRSRRAATGPRTKGPVLNEDIQQASPAAEQHPTTPALQEGGSAPDGAVPATEGGPATAARRRRRRGGRGRSRTPGARSGTSAGAPDGHDGSPAPSDRTDAAHPDAAD